MNNYIGIDLGGTTIRLGLYSEGTLKRVLSDHTKAHEGRDAIIDRIVKNIKKIGLDQVKAIGIGVPGIVSSDNKTVIKCVNIPFENLNLADAIRDRVHVDVKIDNDGNLAALAEQRFGALQGVKNGILLTLGTGIGGGVIINGEMFRGSFGLGFEPGHMVISSNRTCNCGRNGCFEKFSSASALLSEYNRRAVQKATGTYDIFKRYHAKEKLASDMIREYVWYLSIGVTDLIHLFDPEKIVFSGGLSGSFDLFKRDLEHYVKDQLIIKDYFNVTFLASSLGNDSGVLGAIASVM